MHTVPLADPRSKHPVAGAGVQATGDLHRNETPGNGFHPGTGAGMYQPPHGHPQGWHHGPMHAQQMYYGPGVPPLFGMPGAGNADHAAVRHAVLPVYTQHDQHGGMGAAAQGGPPGVMAVAGGPHGGMSAFNGSTSPRSALEGRQSSLNASTATNTTVTKRTWTDFQKCALHVVALLPIRSAWF